MIPSKFGRNFVDGSHGVNFSVLFDILTSIPEQKVFFCSFKLPFLTAQTQSQERDLKTAETSFLQFYQRLVIGLSCISR